MATILMLKPLTAERVSRDAGPSRAPFVSAEIILFPGVRYERWAEAPAASPPKAKRKRRARVKRDRMTIVV